MKYAICQELFEGWEWDRQCEFSASLGYTGMEVAPFALAERITDVTADQRATLKKTAEDHGLEIIGLHWLLAKTEGLHLTTSDAAVRKATSEYLIELAHACADKGGHIMVIGSALTLNVDPAKDYEQALANAEEVFKGCSSALADRNVSICMEPLTSKETDFINTCADATRLIELVGHPNLTLHQDVKAMLGAEEKSIPELIDDYKGRVGHFHVNDTNLLGPGMGETDYAPILRALIESGYDRWVSVEVFDYSPGAEHIAQTSIEYLKRIVAEVS